VAYSWGAHHEISYKCLEIQACDIADLSMIAVRSTAHYLVCVFRAI
jgi:hypothetical protein